MTLMVARFSAYGATLDTLRHVARIFAERKVVGSALTADTALPVGNAADSMGSPPMTQQFAGGGDVVAEKISRLAAQSALPLRHISGRSGPPPPPPPPPQ